MLANDYCPICKCEFNIEELDNKLIISNDNITDLKFCNLLHSADVDINLSKIKNEIEINLCKSCFDDINSGEYSLISIIKTINHSNYNPSYYNDLKKIITILPMQIFASMFLGFFIHIIGAVGSFYSWYYNFKYKK